MNTFFKLNNLVFAVIFAILAIVELLGYIIKDKPHCIYAALIIAVFAIISFCEYRKES